MEAAQTSNREAEAVSFLSDLDFWACLSFGIRPKWRDGFKFGCPFEANQKKGPPKKLQQKGGLRPHGDPLWASKRASPSSVSSTCLATTYTRLNNHFSTCAYPRYPCFPLLVLYFRMHQLWLWDFQPFEPQLMKPNGGGTSI